MYSKENIQVIKKKINLLQKYQYKAISKELTDKIFIKKSQLLMDLAQFFYYSKKYNKAENIYNEIIYEIKNQNGTIKFIELYKKCYIKQLESLKIGRAHV